MSHYLTTLSDVMKKAQGWADENDVDQAKLLETTIASTDAYPLPKHVQIASNASKFVLSRLAGLDVPYYEDDETTFDELYERIEKTVKLLESADREAFQGKETVDVAFNTGKLDVNMPGLVYLQLYALPNFFHHVVTAYNILLHVGVPLRKTDYFMGRQATLSKYIGSREARRSSNRGNE